MYMITKKAERERVYRPFESKRSRIRITCPVCNSLAVQKQRKIMKYICERCGWIGESVKKIEY